MPAPDILDTEVDEDAVNELSAKRQRIPPAGNGISTLALKYKIDTPLQPL